MASGAPDKPIHILFHGAGAVGCFYASRLHHPEQNVHVSLTARSNYGAIAGRGVHLETRNFGAYEFRPAGVYPGVAAAVPAPLRSRPPPSTSSSGKKEGVGEEGTAPPPEKWDIVVITTKALPDRPPTDAETVAPLVSPGHTAIVLIQNGVGIEAPFRSRFPTNPVLSAITVVSAAQTSPGVVKQHRWTRLHLGPWGLNAPAASEEERDTERALLERGSKVARDLARWWGSDPDIPAAHGKKTTAADNGDTKEGYRWGGIRDVEALSASDLQVVRWHKLAINASFNPSAVLCGGKGNADMISDPEMRAHIKGVMNEIIEAIPKVLDLPGDKLPEHLGLADPERILKSTERNVGSKPSMLLDWEAGRAMEIEVILGNPVRIARGKGVRLQRVETMYALVRSAQQMREKAKEEAKEKGKL